MINNAQLRDCPSDWKRFNLGDIADIKAGISFPIKYQGQSSGDYPFYKVSDMNTKGNKVYLSASNNWITNELVQKKGWHAFPKDTIVFPKVGGALITNKKRILSSDALFDNNIMGVTVNHTDICIPLFLYYWLLRFDLKQISNAGPLPSINANAVKGVALALPCYEEQLKIDTILTTVQEAGNASMIVIDALKELKKSLMEHLFNFGPVPIIRVGRTPLKEIEDGTIPADWDAIQLKSFLREPLKNGFSARESPSNEGIRTLTLTAVTKNDFSPRNTKITVARPEDVKDLWLCAGDIFIERANTADLVGIAARYTGKNDYAIFPDLLVRVRVREDEINTKYLVEHLMSQRIRRYYQRNASGAAGNMPKIRHATIEETEIAVPPKPVQDEIADILTTIDNRIIAEVQYFDALDKLFNTLLDGFMTGSIIIKDLEI